MTGSVGMHARMPRRAAIGAIAGVIGASAVGLPRIGHAQRGAEWPSQPVRYINPFPPGGATDTLARIWCGTMSEIAGQQFLVENRSGSGGLVGVEAIARSRPDGYTVGMAGANTHAIAPTLYARLPFDPVRDFTMVSGLWRWPSVLIVNNDVPARSLPELIALVRREPGKYAYATSGLSTSMYILGELLKRLAGLDMVHVGYRGGQAALLDLIGGRVQVQIDAISGPLQAIREGKVRALAVIGPERSPALPDVPAAKETIPELDYSGWAALCGPAGIPDPVVQRLSALTKRALETSELVRRFLELGATTFWTTPEEITAIRARDEVRLAPLVRASGARVE